MARNNAAEKYLASRLQNYLAEHYPGATLSGFQFITSGYESEVYAFNLQGASETPKDLILRLLPGEGALQKLTREAHGLRLLHQAGYPVPELFLYETNPAHLGKPFTIQERLSGRSLWPILAQSTPEQAGHLLRRFGELQARLHQLDWKPFTAKAALYESNPTVILDELFAAMRKEYSQYDVKGFLMITDWLESHRMQITVQPAVVHLDFHANNAFLCQDDRMVVIDWTQIAVADYRLDLTWTLMIMTDYGQAGWGEQILQAYSRAAGRPVEQLDYFNVITDTKLLASTFISLQSGPHKLGMRPETLKSLREQAANLSRLAKRIQHITSLTVPEVEAALH